MPLSKFHFPSTLLGNHTGLSELIAKVVLSMELDERNGTTPYLLMGNSHQTSIGFVVAEFEF